MRRWFALVVMTTLGVTACAAAPPPAVEIPPPLPAVQPPPPPAQKVEETTQTKFTYVPHPERDDVVEHDFLQVDAELKAGFDFETGHQHYSGTAQSLFGGFNQRTGQWVTTGVWAQATTDHDAYAKRLDAMVAQQPSPQHVVRALVRKASLADSMWQGITTLAQRGFSVFSASQLATLNAMGQNPANQGLVQLAQDIREQVEAGFAAKRNTETEYVAQLAVAYYAWAIVFAKQFGVTDASVERARMRLVAFRDTLGVSQLSALVWTAWSPSAALADHTQRIKLAALDLP